MPVVVDGEVHLRGRRGVLVPADGLLLRGVGDIPAESCFEGVAASVCEEGRHASGSETCRGRVGEGVVSIVVLGVRVDALPLGFSPADTPCAMSAGCSDGND